MRQHTLEQTFLLTPDALLAQHLRQWSARRHGVFHALQSADVLGQGVVHQHLGHALGLQAIKHALHPQMLPRQHRLGELEHVITGDVEHRAFNVLKAQFAFGVEQAELLNFLVRSQQVALHPIGEKLQTALALVAFAHPLLLLAQALCNPSRQGMALDANGITVQLDPIERNALPTWIAQRLGQQQQRVREGEEGQRSLQFFADRVEGNLLAAHQEIQKLGLLYPEGELGFEDIERAVLNVARYDVFKLTEAVLAGQHLRVQRMLDGLQAEGVAEVLVLFTLAEDIRALKRVKDAVSAGRPLPQVLREQRVWGQKERLFERVLPQLSPATLERLLQSAHQVDGIVKGMKLPNWPTDNWQALLRLALMLCKACSAR